MQPNVKVKLNLDGLEITLGPGGDFSWSEMAALRLQIDRWNLHRVPVGGVPVTEVARDILEALLEVKRVFPGSKIEDWRG